jgi:hypothetical protein
LQGSFSSAPASLPPWERSPPASGWFFSQRSRFPRPLWRRFQPAPFASFALEPELFAQPDILVSNLFSALVITAVVTTMVMPVALRLVPRPVRQEPWKA